MPLRPLVVLILLAFSSSGFAWKDDQIVVGCSVLDLKGELIKTLPGRLCQFFENGSYLTAIEAKLKLIDKNNSVLWEIPLVAHHQMEMSADRKRVLVLARSKVTIKKKELEQDVFHVVNLEGKILHETTAAELMKQANRKEEELTNKELSHFNSFHEIPPLENTDSLPDYIRAGNFVLNARFLGTFFVSSDLKKVLHFLPLKNSHLHNTHDVQVLSSGKLLYFNNRKAENNVQELSSSIDLYDFSSQKTESLFEGIPKQIFFSPDGGSVQQLDSEHIVFSHFLSGTFIYSLRDKKILSNIYKTHFAQGTFFPVQNAKVQNLHAFLKFWK